MVAPNKNQPKQLSPSFSKKDAVIDHSHMMEQAKHQPVMTPLLEMEPECKDNTTATAIATATATSSTTLTEPSTATTKRTAKVQFSKQVTIHTIPALSQEEKCNLFYNKLDKKAMKMELKRLVTYFRSGRGNNSFFFYNRTTDSGTTRRNDATGNIIQLSDDEKTIIGLECHIAPHNKVQSRKRMYRLVMQHQEWNKQHPTYFDAEFLGQNCRTIAASSHSLALERAQLVVDELAQHKQASSSSSSSSVAATATTTSTTTSNKPNVEPTKTVPAEQVNSSQDDAEDYDTSSEYTVTVLCSSEAILFDASATPSTTNTANESREATSSGIETVMKTMHATTTTAGTSSMQAPDHLCMVR